MINCVCVCVTVCVQENSHFIVVDLVLEVLEGVKWTLSSDIHQHTHCNMCTHRHTQEEEEEEAEHPPKTLSILSTDSGFEGKIIFTLHSDRTEFTVEE